MKKVKVHARYKCLACDKFVSVEMALPVDEAKSEISSAFLEIGDAFRSGFPRRVLHFCHTQTFGPGYVGSVEELVSGDARGNGAGIAVICGFCVGRVFEE